MSCKHGMVLPDRAVADQKDAQFILRESCLLQRDVFRNRVILAITFRSCKGGKRRGPSIGLAVLGVIADIANSGVDSPVGLIQLRATRHCFDGLDQSKKLSSISGAAVRSVTAFLEDDLLFGNVGFDTAPFVPEHSPGRPKGEQPKR